MPYTDTTTEYDLKKMDYYFPIANIKNIVRKENETIQTADFKIGYRTTFLHEKGYKGNKDGVKRDKYHSISNELGFRLEGSNLIKKINKISRKYSKLWLLSWRIYQPGQKPLSQEEIKFLKKNEKNGYQVYLHWGRIQELMREPQETN